MGMKTAAMPIFILKNHYGYQDKQIIDGNQQHTVVFPKVVIGQPEPQIMLNGNGATHNSNHTEQGSE
jgi:hypothetical protein